MSEATIATVAVKIYTFYSKIAHDVVTHCDIV